MRNILLTMSLLISFYTLSQKKYAFDYTLVYNIDKPEKNQSNVILYAVNSKENNYVLIIHEKDSITNNLIFTDQKGILVKAKMNKSDFFKAETIVNSCEQTFRYSSEAKFNIKKYSFINLKDTIIKDTVYYHYVLKSKKSLRYQKKKKIESAHFIIDKSAPDFIPFLYLPILYEVWNKNKNIPNGYPKIIYYINCDGVKVAELKLIKAVKLNKYLTIPNECDYTNDEIRNYSPLVNFNRY